MKRLLAVTILACLAPVAGLAQTPAKKEMPATAPPDHGLYRPADV
jgi:hypothetical protein